MDEVIKITNPEALKQKIRELFENKTNEKGLIEIAYTNTSLTDNRGTQAVILIDTTQPEWQCWYGNTSLAAEWHLRKILEPLFLQQSFPPPRDYFETVRGQRLEATITGNALHNPKDVGELRELILTAKRLAEKQQAEQVPVKVPVEPTMHLPRVGTLFGFFKPKPTTNAAPAATSENKNEPPRGRPRSGSV